MSSLRLNNDIQEPTFNTKKDNVVLFQYGKVGSTTLEFSIGNVMRSPQRLRYFDHIEEHYPQGAKTHKGAIAKSMIEQLGKDTEKDGTTWVVTVTRNRFHRDISAYFQNVENWLSKEKVLSMPISQLHDDFRLRSKTKTGTHLWFQTEFMQATGVNLTAYADGFKNGSLYVEDALKERSTRIVLLRFEDIFRWNEILGSYFPRFKMSPPKNVGKLKWYAPRYKEFLNTYKFSKAEIEWLCGGDTMKFYSEEEMLAMAPQCRSSLSPLSSSLSFSPPKLVEDSGRIHVLSSKSKMFLENLNEDSETEITAEDDISM